MVDYRIDPLVLQHFMTLAVDYPLTLMVHYRIDPFLMVSVQQWRLNSSNLFYN